MTATINENLAAALEMDRVESHLHTEPSFNVDDHINPTGLEEVWRFTPLKRLGGLLDGPAATGTLTETTELPEGATWKTISRDEAKQLGGIAPLDRLAALAVAGTETAQLLEIDGELDRPVRITNEGPGRDTTVWNHIVVNVAPFAKATVLFNHVGSATYGAQVTYLVGDGAQLDVISLADWDDDAVHAAQNSVSLGRDTTVRFFEFTLGGDLVRSSTNVDYRGPGGSVDLYGIYFADAGQHLEHRLFIDHTAPKTRSNVIYKGALQGQDAHTVWIGNVLIRKVAEGIETFEQNDNLVLTDGARADSVPNLEIETGEIAGAGHASTTGRFDDEHLFYLQSRGIEETEARRLVVHGFFNDIIRRIGVKDLEERLMSAIEDELAAAGDEAFK